MVVAETALASTIVSPHETMTEPSASFAILPVSIEIEWAPICAVTLCCIYYFPGCARIQAGHPDCRCQFRGDCASLNLALPSALKPKTQGALSAWPCSFIFARLRCGKLRLLPQIQLVDYLFVALTFRAVEV